MFYFDVQYLQSFVLRFEKVQMVKITAQVPTTQ